MQTLQLNSCNRRQKRRLSQIHMLWLMSGLEPASSRGRAHNKPPCAVQGELTEGHQAQSPVSAHPQGVSSKGALTFTQSSVHLHSLTVGLQSSVVTSPGETPLLPVQDPSLRTGGLTKHAAEQLPAPTIHHFQANATQSDIRGSPAAELITWEPGNRSNERG